MRRKLFLMLWALVTTWGMGVNTLQAQYSMSDTCTTPFIVIDTSSSATALGLSDDGEATITIPFDFVFGGVASNTLRVGNNGGVLFNNSTGDIYAGNSALSASSTPGFYPLWDDLYYTNGNVYWDVVGTAPNRKVIIEWYDRHHYSGSGNGVTFELVLSESDMSIRFIYQDVVFGDASYDYGASATIGIVAPNGVVRQYSYNTPSLNGINCILFQPLAADVSVNEIVSPQLTLPCGASGNFDVSVIIGSNGTDTLYNVDVSYSFDNGSWITETIDTVFPFTQDTFTFASQITISAPGDYPLIVAVYNSNDQDGSNDTVNVTIISQPSYNTFTYLDDFEGTQEWIVGGTITSWQLGTPAGSIIDTTFSGSNAWVTNLTGTYNNSENGYVESPCFDFTALDTPVVELAVNYNTESCCDGGYIRVSLDDGATWNTILPQSSSANWYTSGSGWRGNSNGWQIAKCVLDTLGHKPSVKFRVYFTSDGSGNGYEGFAFDNFSIYEKPSSDVEVAEIINPIGNLGCGISGFIPVTAKIVSNGYDTLYNVNVSYSVNEGSWITETIDTLLPYNVDTFTFSNQINITSPGNYSIDVAVAHDSDQVANNDTLHGTFIVPELVDIFPYLDNFETPTTWFIGGTTSWQLGTPAGSTINSAFSDSNAWVTNLTGNYNNNENGYVESPCFDFTSLDTPIVELAVNYNTESCCDGALVEVSLDDGSTWITVLPGTQSSNWYTSNSGWRGNSNGWVLAKTILDTLGHKPSVKFRLKFTSDGSVNSYDGVAFDDFKIYDKPHNDLTAIALAYPQSGTCCLTATEQVVVAIANAGTMPQDTFDISISTDGGNTWSTETYFDTIMPSDTLLYTFSSMFDFSVPDTYQVVLAVANAGDEVTFNDTLYTSLVVPEPVTSLPYSQDFELLPGATLDWSTHPTVGYTWNMNSGSTPSSNTGPSGDHTSGSGHYIYTEASNGTSGDEAFLTSPCLNFSGSGLLRFSFWYHMYGNAINVLYVEGLLPSHTWIVLDSIVGQQQTASTDPWLQREISIPDTLCQLRFRAVKGGSYEGDISIDDIQIAQAPDYDLAAKAILRPVSGCIHTATDTVTLQVINEGQLDVNSLTLAYSLDSGNTWVTETYSGTLASGDTLIYDFSTTADLSSSGTYYLMAYVSQANDTLHNNDSIAVELEYIDIVLPYTETFETFATTPSPGVLDNGWVATPFTSSTYSWTVNSGSTPSSTTGPAGDHTTGNGIYLYTEASNGLQGDEAVLTSPCFNTSAITGNVLVSFWYHMYGSSINKLYVDVAAPSSQWTTVDSIVGPQQSTETDDWKMEMFTVPVTDFGKIRFRAVRGSSYEGDISIDDIFIGQAADTNLVALNISGPASSCVLGNSESISITVMNMGADTLNQFYVSYSLDTGNTWTTEQVTYTLTPGSDYTYTFSSPADFSAAGDYMITGLVGVLNDTIHSDDTAYGYVTHIPTIDTFEYFVDFENGMSYWTSGGTGSWEYGTPANVTPYSGNYCWGTNLTGNYNNNEMAYLYTPCFDFSMLAAPEMQFAINHNTESCCDEVYVEYSTDTGATWHMLGANGDSAWYNDADGFVGSSNGWTLAYHDLAFLAGQPHVQFRFVMSSDASVTYDGVYIDDFRIYQTTLPDLAVVYPENGGTVSICSGMKAPVIAVKNTGTIPVASGTQFDINYQINGGTLHTQTVTLTSDMMPGDSIIETFNDVYYFANNQTYQYKLYISFANDDYANDTVVGNYVVQDLVVDLGPDTIWTTQPDTIVLTPGSGYVSYSWSTGDTTPTLAVDTFGVFAVSVTDYYGCTASDSVVIEYGVNNDLVNGQGNIVIYPNPNDGKFTVSYAGNGLLTVVSADGKVVYENMLRNNKAEINLRKYGSGVYVLKLRSEGKMIIRKIIVR